VPDARFGDGDLERAADASVSAGARAFTIGVDAVSEPAKEHVLGSTGGLASLANRISKEPFESTSLD
jgi:hypothetical protein